jgi:hypothetical protein
MDLDQVVCPCGTESPCRKSIHLDVHLGNQDCGPVGDKDTWPGTGISVGL